MPYKGFSISISVLLLETGSDQLFRCLDFKIIINNVTPKTTRAVMMNTMLTEVAVTRVAEEVAPAMFPEGMEVISE